MLYITIILLLSIFSYCEMSGRIKTSLPFKFFWIVLTLMLMFRYGQGTDYYVYSLQYDYIDANDTFSQNALYHGEIGWYMLMLAMKKMGIDFFAFIGILSFVMMVCIFRFIKKYSPGAIFSLLLFFPTFYLTYCYSAMRQGLVMTLFLGIGVPLLLERKYIYYYVCVGLLSFIHTSAIVLLMLPPLIDIKQKKYVIFIGGFVLFIIVSYFSNYLNIAGAESYLRGDTSILGNLVRIFMYILIFVLHRDISKYDFQNKRVETILFNVYTIGFVLFLIFSSASTFSQRISMPFKVVEVALLPIQVLAILKRKKMVFRQYKTQATFVALLVVLIMNVEFVKNIHSYINQGNYKSWVTPLNYPYISVFDKDEIYNYITEFDI